MAATWIIAADESRARVLQVTGRDQHLTELQDRELQSDAEPRFNGRRAEEREQRAGGGDAQKG